jgi:hypothetical protein
MKALFEVLAVIARWFEKIGREREQREHQHEAEQVRKDPVDWFTGHFSDGVRKPQDAPDANKTPADPDSK